MSKMKMIRSQWSGVWVAEIVNRNGDTVSSEKRHAHMVLGRGGVTVRTCANRHKKPSGE